MTLSDGAIRNAYTLRIRNLTGADREFRVLLASDEILRMELETGHEINTHVTVPANATQSVRAYVTARATDPAATRERTELSLWIEDIQTDDRSGATTVFNGKVAP